MIVAVYQAVTTSYVSKLYNKNIPFHRDKKIFSYELALTFLKVTPTYNIHCAPQAAIEC